MPEEVNRVLTDRVSRWLYTPTDTATAHLIREGMDPSRIIQVGDVMLDVARFQGTRVNAEGGALARFGLTPGQYILVTIHRAENTDDPQRLGIIVDALMQVGADHEVVWPLHPRTRNILEKLGLRDKLASRIKLVEPVGYLDMVQLEKYCKLVLTDSGGVQKEAFFHERPCVTVRDETEWTELVDAGWNRLAPPTSVEGILSAIGMALTHQPTPTSP
ncbi:hypothetical protein G6F31_013574 [Rhizopus arrhizus]|nr:hypothetical protein G6F31_013574 [Rhizopus arrhizus]